MPNQSSRKSRFVALTAREDLVFWCMGGAGFSICTRRMVEAKGNRIVRVLRPIEALFRRLTAIRPIEIRHYGNDPIELGEIGNARTNLLQDIRSGCLRDMSRRAIPRRARQIVQV